MAGLVSGEEGGPNRMSSSGDGSGSSANGGGCVRRGVNAPDLRGVLLREESVRRSAHVTAGIPERHRLASTSTAVDTHVTLEGPAMRARQEQPDKGAGECGGLRPYCAVFRDYWAGLR